MPFCIPVLLSRRICAFTYSLDFLSNEKFPTNKPKQPTLVDYALCSPCRVPPGSETGQQDSDSGRTVQQLSDNRSQKRLGSRVFRFLGSNPCFFLLSKSLFLKQFLCSLSFFTFCPPFKFIYCRVLWVAGEVRGLPSGVSCFSPLWNLGTELRLT